MAICSFLRFLTYNSFRFFRLLTKAFARFSGVLIFGLSSSSFKDVKTLLQIRRILTDNMMLKRFEMAATFLWVFVSGWRSFKIGTYGCHMDKTWDLLLAFPSTFRYIPFRYKSQAFLSQSESLKVFG